MWSCIKAVDNTENLWTMSIPREDTRKNLWTMLSPGEDTHESTTGKKDDDIYSGLGQNFREKCLTMFHWSLWFDLIEDASANSKICSILSFSTVVYISAYSLLCMWNHPSLLLHFITYDLMLYPKQFRKFHFYWSLVKWKIQRGHSFSFSFRLF